DFALDRCFLDAFDRGDATLVDRLLVELSERFAGFVSRVLRRDICEDDFSR
ncbi:unnamed protein product, partial [Rotaria magnacalcarata]